MHEIQREEFNHLIRIKFHILRFKNLIVYGIILGAIVLILMEGVFPKEEELNKFILIIIQMGLEQIFAQLNTEAVGWLFWISFEITIYLYLIIAILGILIGAKVFPTSQNENMELLISNNTKSLRMFLLENTLSGFIALLIVLIPTLFITLIASVLRDATSIIPRILVSFIFLSIEGMFFLTLSTAFCSIWFTRSAGLKGGFLYLVLAQVFEVISSTDKNYGNLKNFSINSYLNISLGFIKEEYNWTELFIVLTFCLIFTLIALWRINTHQILERVGQQRKRYMSFLNINFKGKLPQRFPSFFEQLIRDRGYLLTWIILAVVYYTVHLFEYGVLLERGQFVEVLAAFDNPFFKALIHNNIMTPNFMGILGFFAGLGVLLVGIFTMIIAANIPNTDVKNENQDLVLTNNTSIDRIMIYRVIAMIFEIMAFYFIIQIVFILMGYVANGDLDYYLIMITYLIGVIHFAALGVFLTGISMIIGITRGRTVSIWLYIAFIVVMISSFIDESLKNLNYLSFPFYFDAGGIMVGKTNIGNSIITNLILLLLSITVFILALKFKYKKSDFIIKYKQK